MLSLARATMNLMCVALGVLCFGEGKPAELPDGWLFIEAEGIDTATGAYHDRISGLLVRMEADVGGNSIFPWAVEQAEREDRTASRRESEGSIVWEFSKPDPSSGCEKRVASMSCSNAPRASWNLGQHMHCLGGYALHCFAG